MPVKVAAVAKATYQRKRTTTQVVPADVTRARASKWFDLISPITEWAGLKGDALRFQRDQLRIRQEAALESLAAAIRQLSKTETIVNPLPPKVFVPALEAASLEAPDSPLIDWWARLLVSGATRAPIRPFLVDLMGKIDVAEANCLEGFWYHFGSDGFNAMLLAAEEYEKHIDSLAALALVRIRSRVNTLLQKGEPLSYSTWHEKAEELISPMAAELGIGVSISLSVHDGYRDTDDGKFNPVYSNNISNDAVSIDVCRALNLLGIYENTWLIKSHYDFWGGLADFEQPHSHIHAYSQSEVAMIVKARIYHFTALGVEFMKATH